MNLDRESKLFTYDQLAFSATNLISAWRAGNFRGEASGRLKPTWIHEAAARPSDYAVEMALLIKVNWG